MEQSVACSPQPRSPLKCRGRQGSQRAEGCDGQAPRHCFSLAPFPSPLQQPEFPSAGPLLSRCCQPDKFGCERTAEI